MGVGRTGGVIATWVAALCLWAGPAAAACPPGTEPTCAKAAVDSSGCCPVAAEAPQWCAPGRVLQGHCCAAGRAWSVKAGKCVDAEGGCKRGNAEACLLAGEAARALGRPADLGQAEKRYAKACAAGLTRACVRQAEVQFPNAQGPEAQARLRAVFEKACAAADPLACSDLGVFYAYGIGIPADPAKAAALRKGACAAGEIDGCVDRARQQD